MKLTRREIPGVVVVDVHGKLIGGPDSSEEFHELFKSLLRKGNRNIVINLEHTPWASSSGVGMLIGAHACVSAAGGELVLAHVADKINNILTIKVSNITAVSRLLLVFKVFDDVDEAVGYLIAREKQAGIG